MIRYILFAVISFSAIEAAIAAEPPVSLSPQSQPSAADFALIMNWSIRQPTEPKKLSIGFGVVLSAQSLYEGVHAQSFPSHKIIQPAHVD